jgi:hypothetical protein
VLQDTEDSVSLRLHGHIRKTCAFVSSLSGKAPTELSSLQNLVNHVAIAIPQALEDTLPPILATLSGDNEAQAILAVDALALLLSAPAVRQMVPLQSTITKSIFLAADSDSAELRKKVTNTLPSLGTFSARSAVRTACDKVLKSRLRDINSGVRVSAIRAFGALLHGASAAELDTGLELLVSRLKDTSEDVRSMVRIYRSAM